MNTYADFIVISVFLINLIILSSSRIAVCIKLTAVQGVLAALTPFIIPHSVAAGVIIASVFNVILKGMVFPWLLFRALQDTNIRKEVEPVGGYPFSLLLGVVFLIMSFWLDSRIVYSKAVFSNLAVPAAFSTFLTGIFIIVSRMKALTQIIGYLILENGIYFFGSILLSEQPLLVELAVLLDIFVAVFVMGVAIFQINKEFDHIDTSKLSELKDWVEPQKDMK